jgi:hypothetical protein
MGLEISPEAKNPERAVAVALAELGVGGRERTTAFEVLGFVGQIADVAEQ